MGNIMPFMLFLAVCAGALMAMALSKKAQLRVMLAVAALMVAVCGRAQWQNSMEWRVRNAPAFATSDEKESIANMDEINVTLERVRTLFADLQRP